jgi:ABC-type phosphate transport system substrate-binding protein
MKPRMRLAKCLGWIVFGLAGAGHASANDVVVVVSSKNPPLQLSKEQVADIFLGRAHRFPDGRRAVPIDLGEGSPVREAFYDTFLGRSAAQMKAHWSKIIFTGRGQPPRQVADEREARLHLSENADAVAYLAREQVDASVRIVSPQ